MKTKDLPGYASVAAFLVPSSLDESQTLRLRRFGLAALTYSLTTLLVAVTWTFGVIPTSAAVEVVGAYLAINVGVYVAIRSGFNRRFKDPSLTRFQILAAITIVMYITYHMDDGREMALFGCFVVFLFGTFRLGARQFIAVTLYTVAGYGLVINLLMHLRPQAIQNVHHEWMSWLVFAGILPCFIFIGGQINTLKRGLRESEARFRALTEMSSDFFWETDAEHRLKNRSQFGRVSARPEQTQVGHRRWEVPYLSPGESHWQAHRADLDAHRPFRHFELSRRAPDGSERHVSISGDPVFDSLGVFKGYRGVGTNITARKRFEQELRESAQKLRLLADDIQHVAHHDSLTGLANRLLFTDRLDQAVRVARRGTSRIALLFLDLDKFKPVNDLLGHAAGDELLKAVADRIRAQVRESDTVARIGGDEFTVILQDIDGRVDADAVAAKIAAAFGEPFQIGAWKKRVDIGTSIGIALFPDDAHTADSLVKAADDAMYRAKRGSRAALAVAA